MVDDVTQRVLRDPAFKELEQKRNKLGWTLSAITLVIYYGFILVVAFSPSTLATPLGGMTMTLGLPVGVGIILASILMTGIYVRRANSVFDALVAKIKENAK
ncbi:DUF485 domain-containing protein [Nevskia soli]|uniref:DUF485 domain-containing protein n=1 Tax=Nevskia soli TaxID=418856 RepID=UPI0004A6E8A7|nr:DUF485 domain-containing protein [Nevskia soli]